MIKRRLYRQIYFTIIVSLLAIVLVVGALFVAMRGDGVDFDEQIFGMTGRLAWMALPPATAPNSEQAAAIDKLGNEFEIDINLFDRNKKRIAKYGERIEPPDQDEDESGWHRSGHGPTWQIRLPDDRWLSVNLRRDKKRRPLFGVLTLLVGIAAAIGLASYPFVRKLTGRLERLQHGVEQVGDGELSTRVEVEGKDEVAGLARSFNESAEKIERLVNSNRQLLANASHELRTPLARVRLGVEMLKKGKNPARQEALEQDINELDTLIDEILLMSRLDTGSAPQMNEYVDLLALAAEECARYEDCSLTGQIVEVQGNSTLLRRAVRNLLDNAFKHGKAPVKIQVDRIGSNAVITVSDAGDGIRQDLHEKVFQPFYRASDRQNVEGFGLGLALVRQIAEAHKGQAIIMPFADSGSAIRIEMPAA